MRNRQFGSAVLLAGFALGCAPDATAPTAVSSPIRPSMGIDPLPGATSSGVDNAILRWNNELCVAIRIVLPGPTVVARAISVLHTATYDAWAAYDARAMGTQLGNRLRRPAVDRTETNKDRAISYAAYRVLSDLFPAQRSLFDAEMRASGYDPSDGSVDQATATGVGNIAADRRAQCQAPRWIEPARRPPRGRVQRLHRLYASEHARRHHRSEPLAAPALPTTGGSFVIQKYTTPQWNRVTPFALRAADQFRPPFLPNQYRAPVVVADRTDVADASSRGHGPTADDEVRDEGGAQSDGYARQVEQILRYSANLDDRTKIIAEYRADGPNSELPPGHWCLFTVGLPSRPSFGG